MIFIDHDTIISDVKEKADAAVRMRTVHPINSKKNGVVDYRTILLQYGLCFEEKYPWLLVNKSTIVQGWKLHVSASPVNADKILALVLPFLHEWGGAFKIAKDSFTLASLNEGGFGETQVGKFMTVYPEPNEKAVAIATTLSELTKEFIGPTVITDLRISDIVFARYGGFNPIVQRDRLGNVTLYIRDSRGELIKDEYHVPFAKVDGIPCPFIPYVPDFEKIPDDTEYQGRSEMLLGGKYLIFEIVKRDAKGSVFKGIDVRKQECVSVKIIKQGMRYCLMDDLQRDMRDRLKRQESLQNTLTKILPTPRADEYFEAGGNGYLPMEYIAGTSIEQLALTTLAGRPWGVAPAENRLFLLDVLRKFLLILQKLHTAGYVHRDLTASNVWIGKENNEVYLLDLELTHNVSDATKAFGMGTPGFMSPQQANGERPDFSDDIYAAGCVMMLVLTGIDPRRVVFMDEERRVQKLKLITQCTFDKILSVMNQCIHSKPDKRPALPELRDTVLEYMSVLNGVEKKRLAAASDAIDYGRCIRKGVTGILSAAPQSETGIWLSLSPDSSISGTGRMNFELRRSANRGVAGVIYCLSRIYRYGFLMNDERSQVKNAIEWIMKNHDSPDSGLPGLHFGEAGVAVALAEAIHNGVIDKTSGVVDYIRSELGGPIDWPDITHGAAGQGIAAFYVGDVLPEIDTGRIVDTCAQYLITTQHADGYWRMPDGVAGMSGEAITGFAHGAAGAIYFLAEYSRRTGSEKATVAYDKAVEWLLKESIAYSHENKLAWRYSDKNPDIWKWWCHGSPGISLAFLHLYTITGNTEYERFAEMALDVYPIDFRSTNLSLCHGLAGLGEMYLEAWKVLKKVKWLKRAESIARYLTYYNKESSHEGIVWLVEHFGVPTADLMVGSGGIIHFLNRFYNKTALISFPLLLP